MELKRLDFEGFYIKKPTIKKQIVLHHTVSGGFAQNVANYWKSQHKINRLFIGTHFIIETDGTIVQLFDLDYWCGHIGNCAKSCFQLGLPNFEFSKHAVGIELINWGGLKMIGNQLFNAYNKLHKGQAEKISYRGYEYFERYTDAQIDSLNELLPYLCESLGIKNTYTDDIWDINKNALTFEHGIYSHTSYRLDKSDIYPDERIIEVLKNISYKP